MNKIYFAAACLIQFYVSAFHVRANFIVATSTNYTTYLNTLIAGDTLYLTRGTYTENLTLNGRIGTSTSPIVIMGDTTLYSTVFNAQSCCNTVSITLCAYVVIKNLKLDGLNLYVDAVKGEGTTGNWAHHITLEYLNIVNYGADQQLVGISTKCHAWNWVIRKNIIIGAGTGLYLGNSNGDKPFVNGLIENNLVLNTVGYNMEIKQQSDAVRDKFPGTNVDGKTTIRYNVFCKQNNGSTGGSARPNVLVGAFPSTGIGSNDYYEMYGNFFYQNPNEALLQATGNMTLYENIFVNHFDPAGFRAIYVTAQNGFQPRNIKIFHNTVWAANSSGGIRLYNPNTAFQQYCHANVVFASSAVTNFTNSVDNITDSYANASAYVLSASTSLTALNLYPQNGQLTGAATSNTLFTTYIDWDKDFNGNTYDWTYRGAYSGCCTNNGWQLQLDTMPVPSGMPTAIIDFGENNRDEFLLYPNPVTHILHLSFSEGGQYTIEIRNTNGIMESIALGREKSYTLDMTKLPTGIYFLTITDRRNLSIKKSFIKL